MPGAELLRLRAVLPGDDMGLLPAVLAMHVPYGWEEDTLPTGETVAIVHGENPAFMAELAHALRELFPAIRMEQEAVERKDWALAWREYFTPVEAGRFLVLPPWMATRKKATGAISVIIKP